MLLIKFCTLQSERHAKRTFQQKSSLRFISQRLYRRLFPLFQFAAVKSFDEALRIRFDQSFVAHAKRLTLLLEQQVTHIIVAIIHPISLKFRRLTAHLRRQKCQIEVQQLSSAALLGLCFERDGPIGRFHLRRRRRHNLRWLDRLPRIYFRNVIIVRLYCYYLMDGKGNIEATLIPHDDRLVSFKSHYDTASHFIEEAHFISYFHTLSA